MIDFINHCPWGYGLGTIIGQIINVIAERKWR